MMVGCLSESGSLAAYAVSSVFQAPRPVPAFRRAISRTPGFSSAATTSIMAVPLSNVGSQLMCAKV